MSIYAQRAIEDAQHYGQALLKFISANDLGLTNSHQSGFYLPKEAWALFTTQAPVRGVNHNHMVRIIWPDGEITNSCVKWYGVGTRSEYRLTRFGRDFNWRQPEFIGSLLVIIPEDINNFRAYILDTDDEIDDIQISLGVEIVEGWALFPQIDQEAEFDQDVCINNWFRVWVEEITILPTVSEFSDYTRETLIHCIQNYQTKMCDDKLLLLIENEYRLYKIAERKVKQAEINRLFRDIDDFLRTANSILQSRKSRAGKSFENQVTSLLEENGVIFVKQPTVDNTRPDIIIPSVEAYYDDAFPIERKFAIGLKRTCKDRWRQVLQEAPRIPIKHLITMQNGISAMQLNEMNNSRVKLIVPRYLHNSYPPNRPMVLITLDEFIRIIRNAQ